MLREVLDKTAERVGKDLKDNPEVEAELRYTLGAVYFALGDYTRAEIMHRQALALRMQLFGNEHLDVAESLDSIAELLRQQRVINSTPSHRDKEKFAEAEPLCRQALAIRTRLLPGDHVDVATSLDHLGEVVASSPNFAEAEPILRQALAMRRRLLGTDNLAVADSLDHLADVLRHVSGKVLEAESLQREALALRRKLLGNQHPVVANSLFHLGKILQDARRLSEAESTYREVLTLQTKMLGPDHPLIDSTLSSLADVVFYQYRYAEAQAVYGTALELRRKLYGNEHLKVAATLGNIGYCFCNDGKLAESEAPFRESLGITTKVHGTNDPSVDETRRLLAYILERQRKFAEAEPLYRESVTVRKKVAPEDWYTFYMQTVLGRILLGQKKYVEAEPLLRSGYEGIMQRQASIPEDSKWLSPPFALNKVFQPLVQLYEATGRSEQAAEWTNKLDEAEQSGRRARQQYEEAAALEAGGKFEKAEIEYRKAAEAGNFHAMNGLAWLLATAADPKLRDGAAAISYAEKAIAMAGRKRPHMLDTLAAAYAEAGKFTEAVSVQKEAMALLKDPVSIKGYSLRLKLYEAHTPYHSPATQEGPPAGGQSK